MRANLALRTAKETSTSRAFEIFVEECERAPAAFGVETLLIAAARAIGAEYVLLASHNQAASARGRFGVLLHNWPKEALAHVFGERSADNPLFERVERSTNPLVWDDTRFRAGLSRRHAQWFERLAALGVSCGVTQCVRSAWAPASCSLCWLGEAPSAAEIAQFMRMAAYAAFVLSSIEGARGGESDVLTRRERQCLEMAIFDGLRPREVAGALGLSINTVRSMRKSACARLGARTSEEAVWRLMESGQLFHRGRPGRPRRL